MTDLHPTNIESHNVREDEAAWSQSLVPGEQDGVQHALEEEAVVHPLWHNDVDLLHGQLNLLNHNSLCSCNGNTSFTITDTLKCLMAFITFFNNLLTMSGSCLIPFVKRIKNHTTKMTRRYLPSDYNYHFHLLLLTWVVGSFPDRESRKIKN